ncbi:DoxX family protein, partial [Pseudomonas sp. BGM005]|nr:DoxX family protein [Pseudomonas sp. BG5]
MARAIAIIVARIIFSVIFLMAAGFKFADIGATAAYI